MLKKIVIVFVVAVAGLLAFAATRPDTFHIERSTNIRSPSEKIFPYIANLHSWEPWSPYEKRDPNMKKTFSGPDMGQGATYAWDGNSDVGAGQMKVLEATPQKIVIQLDFSRPFEGHNVVTFTLTPKGDTTDVTWAMDGPNAFMSKLFGIFMNIDKMVGADFEAGLANLKTLVEQQAASPT